MEVNPISRDKAIPVLIFLKVTTHLQVNVAYGFQIDHLGTNRLQQRIAARFLREHG